MGFNCAQEKAKFDREWLRLRKEYTDAGIAALDGITAADEEHKSFLRELLMSLVEREK